MPAIWLACGLAGGDIIFARQAMEARREHIDPGWESSFVTRRLSMERFDSIYHFHPEYELTWIQSGSGHILAGDYLGPGHLALLGPACSFRTGLPWGLPARTTGNEGDREAVAAVVPGIDL